MKSYIFILQDGSCIGCEASSLTEAKQKLGLTPEDCIRTAYVR